MRITKQKIQTNDKYKAGKISIILSSWLTPKVKSVDYNKQILKLSKSIKQNLYFRLLNTIFDANRTITITNTAAKLIEPDKQTFIEYDITIYNKNNNLQPLKENVNQMVIETIINEVETLMKNNKTFSFNHKKIKELNEQY